MAWLACNKDGTEEMYNANWNTIQRRYNEALSMLRR